MDWENHVISYARRKTGSVAMMRLDKDMEEILRDLPGSGPLFPYLRTVRSGDRATEFKQRCTGLGIKGVTLHSYRYAWAERAKTAGYPERFAQVNLGHNSKAMARAYSRKAPVGNAVPERIRTATEGHCWKPATPNPQRQPLPYKEGIMQTWQIKALKLEVSALDALNGFLSEHALYFLIGAIVLLLALLAWIMSGGLRPKGGKSMSHVQPGIVIHFPVGRPAPPEFDPFPPHHSAHCDDE